MSRDILLSLIDPDPDQARKTFDAGRLEELAQSMAASGQAVPVLLRPGQDGRFLLVHGERRWRAAQLLGWDTLRAEVQDLTPDQACWLALVENLQRADLSPIEEAQAYQAALSGGLTQAALGQKVGKSQSYIAQKLRLLTLPEPLQFYLDRGALSEGHARQLLRLRNVYGPDLPAAALWTVPEEAHELAYWRQWGNAFELLRDTRPLDALLFVPPDPVPDLLAGGCQALARWWARCETVPQWAVTAFWWAAFAAHVGASVADLKAQIDNWQSIIYSALFRLPIWKDGPPRDELGRQEYWGYRSDLRHSGVSQWAKEAPRQVYLDALAHVGQADSYAAPSSCQPYGPHGVSWPMLTDFEDLKADIAERGILVPVEVDENGAILDGHKRVRAWHELRAEGVPLPDYARLVRADMTEEQKRDHRQVLNRQRDEPELLIGGRTVDQFNQEIVTLRGQLDQAQDLPAVLVIRDRAAVMQDQAAESTLRNRRAAGQAFTNLQEAEQAMIGALKQSAADIGRALVEVQRVLTPGQLVQWLADRDWVGLDVTWLTAFATGAQPFDPVRALAALDTAGELPHEVPA